MSEFNHKIYQDIITNLKVELFDLISQESSLIDSLKEQNNIQEQIITQRQDLLKTLLQQVNAITFTIEKIDKLDKENMNFEDQNEKGVQPIAKSINDQSIELPQESKEEPLIVIQPEEPTIEQPVELPQEAKEESSIVIQPEEPTTNQAAEPPQEAKEESSIVIQPEETTIEQPVELPQEAKEESSIVIQPEETTTNQAVEPPQEEKEDSSEPNLPEMPTEVQIGNENPQNDLGASTPTENSNLENNNENIQPEQSTPIASQISQTYIKSSPDLARAILVTTTQLGKLKTSKTNQKQLLEARGSYGSILPNSTPEQQETTVETQLVDNGLLPAPDDTQKKIETMLEEANKLYKEGKVAEAQQLYDQISELSKQLQGGQTK